MPINQQILIPGVFGDFGWQGLIHHVPPTHKGLSQINQQLTSDEDGSHSADQEIHQKMKHIEQVQVKVLMYRFYRKLHKTFDK